MADINNILSSFTHGSLSNSLLIFLLILTRWLAMSLTMPFLGAELLPALVRIGLASILSLVSFMMIAHEANTDSFSMPSIGLLFIKEALLGFILGFFSSLIFHAYQLFGELVDLFRGASMSKLLVPQLRHASSPMGSLWFQLALITFFSLGLHREILHSAYLSFVTFPVLSFGIDFENSWMLGALDALASLFKMAVTFSLPVVLICFLIDLAFGLINRVAPQINAYFLSLPAKMVSGLIILFFFIPFLLDDFLLHHQELSRIFRLIISN